MFVLVVQLYGTLVLGGRRAGYIIILFGSVLGLIVPVIHMKGTRGVLSGDIGNSGQAFLFVWTIRAVGITSTFSVILSASALLSLPWRRSRSTSTAASRPLVEKACNRYATLRNQSHVLHVVVRLCGGARTASLWLLT